MVVRWLCQRLVALTIHPDDKGEDRRRKGLTVPIFVCVFILALAYFAMSTANTNLRFRVGWWAAICFWLPSAVILLSAFLYRMVPLQLTLSALAAAAVGVFLSDWSALTAVGSIRSWVIAIPMFGMYLALDPGRALRSRGAVVLVASAWLVITSVQDGYDLGMLTVPGWTDYDGEDRAERCNCAEPPCATGEAGGMFLQAAVTVITLQTALFVSAHFAEGLRAEEARMAAAVHTAERVTEMLARWDLDTAHEALKATGVMPRRLLFSYRVLACNLGKYRPYLPESCLEPPDEYSSEEDGCGAAAVEVPDGPHLSRLGGAAVAATAHPAGHHRAAPLTIPWADSKGGRWVTAEPLASLPSVSSMQVHSPGMSTERLSRISPPPGLGFATASTSSGIAALQSTLSAQATSLSISESQCLGLPALDRLGSPLGAVAGMRRVNTITSQVALLPPRQHTAPTLPPQSPLWPARQPTARTAAGWMSDSSSSQSDSSLRVVSNPNPAHQPRQRRVAVLARNCSGLLAASAQVDAVAVGRWISAEVEQFCANVHAQGGMTELLSADHLFATFGALKVQGTCCAAAVSVAQQLAAGAALSPQPGASVADAGENGLQATAAVTCGRALCGDFGSAAAQRFMAPPRAAAPGPAPPPQRGALPGRAGQVIGGVSSFVQVLERAAAAWRSATLVCTGVHLDLQTWHCRLRRQVLFRKMQGRPFWLWEVVGSSRRPGAEAEEWMYELHGGAPNPWESYNEVVRQWVTSGRLPALGLLPASSPRRTRLRSPARSPPASPHLSGTESPCKRNGTSPVPAPSGGTVGDTAVAQAIAALREALQREGPVPEGPLPIAPYAAPVHGAAPQEAVSAPCSPCSLVQYMSPRPGQPGR